MDCSLIRRRREMLDAFLRRHPAVVKVARRYDAISLTMITLCLTIAGAVVFGR